MVILLELPGIEDEDVKIMFEDNIDFPGTKQIVFTCRNKKKPAELDGIDNAASYDGNILYQDYMPPIKIPVPFYFKRINRTPKIKNGQLLYQIEEQEDEPDVIRIPT